MDQESAFKEMAVRHERPAVAEQEALLRALAALEERGILSIDYTKVPSSAVFPWSEETSYRAALRCLDPGFVRSRFDRLHEPLPGSGVGRTDLEGCCHAASEALERLIVLGGGVTKSAAVSSPAPSVTSNAGAFHCRKDQALRAAFAEAIEREVVGRFLLRDPEVTAWDVTAAGAALVDEVGRAIAEFVRLTYGVRLSVLTNPWGLWVVTAVARSHESRHVRAGFRGFGCDFDFRHAATHAITELARNAFFGPAATADSEATVLEAALDADDSAREVALLSLGRYVGLLGAFMETNGALDATEILRLNAVHAPASAARAFAREGRTARFVLLHQHEPWLPGYAIRVWCTGFADEYPSLIATALRCAARGERWRQCWSRGSELSRAT